MLELDWFGNMLLVRAFGRYDGPLSKLDWFGIVLPLGWPWFLVDCAKFLVVELLLTEVFEVNVLNSLADLD